jgi:indole-3-glycerol phosphate synthase
MHNILNEIISHKKSEIAQIKAALPQHSLTIRPCENVFVQSLIKHRINIIAEIKPKSPSAGILSKNFQLEAILPAYEKYASALSVLTDTKYFAGSFDLLEKVSEKTNLPTLCKDFILDPYQCYMARHCGAQAVLLIVKILSDEELMNLHFQIKSLGMTVVMEIQNEIELERINKLALKKEIILINNRNLEDFTINLDTTKQLAPQISDAAAIVSASGIESKKDLEKLIPFCTNFLIGSMFMRSADPETEFKKLIDVKLPSKSQTNISIGS